jgi:general secretion pathway protein G
MKKNIKNFLSTINQKGFTLVEILVAATIVALLSTLGVSGYQAVTRNGRDALRKSDLEQIRSALEIYKSENSSYPTPQTTCGPAAVTPYINSYPVDPKPTSYRYCYNRTGNTTYYLCAHLENGTTTDYSTECGDTNICGFSSSSCNYKVANP